MRVLSHPIRLDNDGAMVTMDDGSDRQAAELSGVVIATSSGERPLAPEYGLPDPSSTGLTQEVVVAALIRCEPDLSVTSASIDPGTSNTAAVALSVTWAE